MNTLRIGTTETMYTEKYGYKKGLERMRAHGFDSMDYQEFVNAATPLLKKTPSEFERYLMEQRKIAGEIGISIHQVHGPCRWPTKDATKEAMAKRFEKMTRSIAGTAILGSRNMIVHPIMPYLTNDDEHKDFTYNLNIKFMEKLTEIAKEYDVVLCFENMPKPKFSLASVESTLDFVKTINSNYFKVCLDTGHCTMFPTTAGDAVRKIGKNYLYALHLNDSDGVKDRHWSPFSGIVDWYDFGHALYEINYEGVISLEPHRLSVPDELCEHEEIGLYMRAKYIAELASGIRKQRKN